MTHHDAPSGQPYSEPPMWRPTGKAGLSNALLILEGRW